MKIITFYSKKNETTDDDKRRRKEKKEKHAHTKKEDLKMTSSDRYNFKYKKGNKKDKLTNNRSHASIPFLVIGVGTIHTCKSTTA